MTKDMKQDWLAAVIKVHGAAMTQTVVEAGMGSEAVGRLVARARARQDGEMLAGVMSLAQAFNRISTEYCKAMGWTEEMLALCDRDIQLAFAGRVIVPGKLVLDS
jgi:hypothetical protein